MNVPDGGRLSREHSEGGIHRKHPRLGEDDDLPQYSNLASTDPRGMLDKELLDEKGRRIVSGELKEVTDAERVDEIVVDPSGRTVGEVRGEFYASFGKDKKAAAVREVTGAGQNDKTTGKKRVLELQDSVKPKGKVTQLEAGQRRVEAVRNVSDTVVPPDSEERGKRKSRDDKARNEAFWRERGIE